MIRNLTPREEKLLQFLDATGQANVERAMKAESDIDYNIMMGNLQDPSEEENE